MRGLVLAMVLVPTAIDERIIPAPVDARAVLDQYLRARAARRAPLDAQALERYLRTRDGLVRVEPIPLWYGQLPWTFIPPRGDSPRPTSTGGTALSLGLVRAGFERPGDQLTVKADAPSER